MQASAIGKATKVSDAYTSFEMAAAVAALCLLADASLRASETARHCSFSVKPCGSGSGVGGAGADGAKEEERCDFRAEGPWFSLLLATITRTKNKGILKPELLMMRTCN